MTKKTQKLKNPGKDRHHNYFITTNNPTKEDDIAHNKIKESASYGLWWHEIGDDKGTPHYHLYLEFKNARYWTAMKKKFPRSDIRGAKGQHEHQLNYSEKESSTLQAEWGTPKEQGKRTDLEVINEVIENNGTMADAIKVARNYQGIRTAELLFKYSEKPRPIKPIEVIWIYGDPGAGKTKYAYEMYPEIFRPLSYKWWEGYDGHKQVLLDDLRKSWCKYEELLKVLDIYPFRVETKGGSRQVQYDIIVITCPEPPEDFFICEENQLQLTRRINKVIHLESDTDVGGNINPSI
eukprot:UC4_evm1s1199